MTAPTVRLLEARVRAARRRPAWLLVAGPVVILAASGWLGLRAWEANRSRAVYAPVVTATTVPDRPRATARVDAPPSPAGEQLALAGLVVSAVGALSGVGSVVVAAVALRRGPA